MKSFPIEIAFCSSIFLCRPARSDNTFVLVPISTTTAGPSDFNRPNLEVNCLADGVLVNVGLRDDNFKGVMYVKGHSNDERCRQSVTFENGRVPVDFKVQFGVCGLFHSDVSFTKIFPI